MALTPFKADRGLPGFFAASFNISLMIYAVCGENTRFCSPAVRLYSTVPSAEVTLRTKYGEVRRPPAARH